MFRFSLHYPTPEVGGGPVAKKKKRKKNATVSVLVQMLPWVLHYEG